MMSTSMLTSSPARRRGRVIVLLRVVDKRDAEAVIANIDDGQAGAIDGDEALLARRSARRAASAPTGRRAPAHRQLRERIRADAVDVPLDVVAADASTIGDGPLEVDRDCRVSAVQSAAAKSLGHHVAGERRGGERRDSDAYPVGAMLSPMRVPSSTVRPAIVKADRATDRRMPRLPPISSTMPVNISGPPLASGSEGQATVGDLGRCRHPDNRATWPRR